MLWMRKTLPGKVSERFVGVGHFVDVFAFGHSSTFTVVSCDEFVGEFQVHWATFFVACSSQDPTDGQRLLTGWLDMHRDLICGPTNALGTDFDDWLDVVYSAVEDFDDGIVLDPLFDQFHGVVEDLPSGRFFAVVHEVVNELRGQ